MANVWSCRGAYVLLLLLVCGTFFYRLGAAPLFDDPNEAEYAEVGREMLDSGDWISPQLNYVLFLNKPPLTYWLIALGDRVFGINEFAARLPSAVAGVVIVLLLVRLGTVLFDRRTGLLAGFVLLAMGGFFVETHEVRPDLLLTVSIVGSLLALVRVLQGGTSLRWSLIGLQVALAIGLLSKGMLAVIFPALICGVVLLSERRALIWPRLLHPRAWWLLLVLVAPWHLIIAVTHPGFVWDYIINQHILFFFDRKFPRDSVPVSLAVFGAAFVLRLFPWTLFGPLAIIKAGQRVRRAGSFGDRFTLAWAAVVLLFFSASPARMEHYSIPALPALALLIAKMFHDYARAGSRALQLHILLFAALALLTPVVGPHLVAAHERLAPIADLPALAGWVCGLLAVGGVVAAIAAVGDRRGCVAPAIVATFVAIIPLFVHGLTLFAQVNSSAPMAAAVDAVLQPTDRLVFEAPIEYQNCAAFNFYTRRKLELLLPANFVAPPYLTPYVDALFIRHARLTELWRTERVLLITDPLTPRAVLNGSVPHPYYVIARDTDRWALTNVATSGPVRAHP